MKCYSCNKELESTKNGKCKACRASYAKEWRLKNYEKRKQYEKEYYSERRPLYREREKVWRSKNPDKIRNSNLKHGYGITLEDYKKMCLEQDHKCLICNNISKLFVDHCHKTKKVRGLLCNSCNKALGLFKDNPKALERAAIYVKV